MSVSPDMTDAELKEFIDKGEQFFHEPGEVYNDLLAAGYSKEKIDAYIAEKKKGENRSFRTITLFFSFIFVSLGVLCITGYFGGGWLPLVTGMALGFLALSLIRKAFDD